MKKLVYYTIIFLFSVYVLMLVYTNKLTFYIHPRYVDLTNAAAIVTLVFSLFGLQSAALKFFREEKHKKLSRDEIIAALLVSIPLIIGFILPVMPLSSATASQRSIDFNTLQASEIDSVDLFSSDTKSYSLGDWAISLNSTPDLNLFKDKEVDVTGFIYEDDSTPEGLFLVTRFAVTCCAVDARPVGLDVKYDWEEKFKKDEWVRVQGKFEIQEVDGEQRVVIVPSSVTKISTPDDPYIY